MSHRSVVCAMCQAQIIWALIQSFHLRQETKAEHRGSRNANMENLGLEGSSEVYWQCWLALIVKTKARGIELKIRHYNWWLWKKLSVLFFQLKVRPKIDFLSLCVQQWKFRIQCRTILSHKNAFLCFHGHKIFPMMPLLCVMRTLEMRFWVEWRQESKSVRISLLIVFVSQEGALFQQLCPMDGHSVHNLAADTVKL